MKIVSYIFLLIILLFVVIFAIYNSSLVKIDYIVGSKDIPLVLVLAISLFIGAFLTSIISFIKYVKILKENLRLKNQIKVAQKEINNLREMPLRESH